MASTLVAFRQLQFLSEPATLDGGDVLRLDERFMGVGPHQRCGVQQLRDILARWGYEVERCRGPACI